MAKDFGTEDGDDAGAGADASDPVPRLVRVSSRSCILAIDQLMCSLPRNTASGGTAGCADAATDAALIARRMTRATRDFGATATALLSPPDQTR